MTSFGERLSSMTNATLVGLTVSLANEHGLFQAMLDAAKPITSEEIAKSKDLKERYVREALNAMATAELVQAQEDEQGRFLYSLEDGAKEALDGTLKYFIGYPSLFCGLYPSISACFPEQGPQGVRYNEAVQNQFDQLAVISSPIFIKGFLDVTTGLRDRLEQGIEAIEFGAGMGRMSSLLAQQFPNSRFIGSDASSQMVEASRQRWEHINNLTWSTDDLCSIPESPQKTFDWVFCNDVIHDLPDPPKALRGIKRLLNKPGGLFTFVDVCTAGNPVKDMGNMLVAAYYSASTFLCVPESFQGAGNSMALGACWGKQTALDMIKDAGFEVQDFMVDRIHIIYVCRLPK